MTQPATRLITLIMCLQRQPNQRAEDLANALGVSVRTIHRYMGMLEEMGIPIYSERGRNGGFSLARGYKMPPLVFTPEEATAVHLGTTLVTHVWGNLYEEAAQGALAKLDNVMPEEQRREIAWASRTLVAINMSRIEQDDLMVLLATLRNASRQEKRVRLWYQGRSQPTPIERDLDVYALVFSSGWWYAIGYCHLRQAIRSFRVDRIKQLSLLDASFIKPDDFDVHRYLAANPPPHAEVQVRMRFKPEGRFLAEYGRSLWQEMLTQADGSLIVTFGAQNLTVAASTILGYGPMVKVLEPEALQELLYEWGTAVAEQYQNKRKSK